MSRQGLPRFTASAQVGGSPISAATGGAASLTELGQRVQQFGEQNLQRASIQRAQDQGELAGLDPNFRPSRFPSAATEEFNKAALATNRTLMGTDIILNTEKLKNQAVQSSPDAAIQLQTFNKSMSQYGNQLFNQAPAANKAYTQNMLAYHTAVAHNAFMHNLHQQQQVKASAQWLQSDNSFHADTLRAVENINFNLPEEEIQKQIGAAGALLSQRNNSTMLAAQGGLIKNPEKQIQNNNKEFNSELISSQFRTKLFEGGEKPQKFIEQVLNHTVKGPNAGFLKGFNDNDRYKLATRLRKEQKLFANGSAVNKKDVSQQAKGEWDRIQNGGTPNLSMKDAYVQAFPNRGDHYDEQVSINKKIWDTFNGLQQDSFEEQSNAIRELTPNNPNNPNYERQKKIIETASSKIVQQNHQISEQGAFTFFQSNPAVQESLNKKASELSSGINFDTMKSSGIKPLSPDPIERNISAQVMKGIPYQNVEVISKQAGNRFASYIKSNIPLTDKIRAMRQMQGRFGRWYPQLMLQLNREDKLSTTDSFIGSLDPNDPDLPIIDQALKTPSKVFQDKFNVPDDKVKALDAQVSALSTPKNILFAFPSVSVLAGIEQPFKFKSSPSNDAHNFVASFKSFAPNGTATYLDNYKNFSRNMALSYLAANPNMSAEDAWNKANSKIAGKFTYTNLGGAVQRIPRQFSPDSVANYAKKQISKLKDFDFIVGRSASGVKLSRQQELKNNILPGHYVTNAQNDGFVWVRADGTLLRNKQGNPFIVKFSDAMSNSELNTEQQRREDNRIQEVSDFDLLSGGLISGKGWQNFI